VVTNSKFLKQKGEGVPVAGEKEKGEDILNIISIKKNNLMYLKWKVGIRVQITEGEGEGEEDILNIINIKKKNLMFLKWKVEIKVQIAEGEGEEEGGEEVETTITGRIRP
jgi:pyruvate/oxaloacetate carboxyltransferase